ncbi:MAG: hypothetical protein AAFU53_19910 [Cyanobacteria bacterium J06632_3]
MYYQIGLGAFFAVLTVTGFALALQTKSWRLKTVSSALLGCWVISTVLDPITVEVWWLDPVYSLVMILLIIGIQARGRRERDAGISREYWIVGALACEFGIVLTYFTSPILGNVQSFFLQQGFYFLELALIVAVGAGFRFARFAE